MLSGTEQQTLSGHERSEWKVLPQRGERGVHNECSQPPTAVLPFQNFFVGIFRSPSRDAASLLRCGAGHKPLEDASPLKSCAILPTL